MLTIVSPPCHLQKLQRLCRPENENHNNAKQPEQFPLNPDKNVTPAANEYKPGPGIEMETQI